MELAQRFEEVTSSTSVNISSLVINRLYPIVHAKRINTKYVPIVLLSIWDSDEKLVRIFLPKRYASVVSDDDIEKIHSKSVYLNLVFNGSCETERSYLLAIDL